MSNRFSESSEHMSKKIFHLFEKSDLFPQFSLLYSLDLDRLLRNKLNIKYGVNYSSVEVCRSSIDKLRSLGHVDLTNKRNEYQSGEDDVIFNAEAIANQGDISKAIIFAYKNARFKEVKSLSLLYANYKAINDNSRVYLLNKYLNAFNQEIGLDTNCEQDFYYKINSRNKYYEIFGPKVTVIMPVFNAEKTISMAIKSILNQTWRALELIVVDDCSLDRTFDICKNFEKEDSRVKVFKMRGNVGSYSCRNLGVIKSTGEFITVHDGDDWAFPNRIEQQVNAILESTADACTGGMLRMNSVGKVTRPSSLGRLSSDGYLRLCFVSLMVRAEVFKKHLGAWDYVRVGGDAEMLERINNLKIRMIHIDIPLMLCLDDVGSLTNDLNYGLHNQLRDDYISSYRKWHESDNVKYIDIRSCRRNFIAPVDNVVDEFAILESFRYNGVI